MCIAIVKLKDKSIPKETLEICSKNNPDGCGFAYSDNGKVYIKKFMDFETFYEEYSKVENKSTMLIHFRIATHGKVETKNCHPFKLNNRMALIHNGVISGYGDKDKKTDTQDFIDKVIGNISWKMWKNPSFIELVNNAIGYSKLCILDVDGNHFIVGEEKGEWVDGVWFSNKSYKPKEIKPKTTCAKQYYNQGSLWDMYGEESYDDWYNRTLSTQKELETPDTSCKVVYKCKKCGNEVAVDEYYDDFITCDKCTSDRLVEVGFIYGGDRYDIAENGDYVLVDSKKVLA